MLEEVQIEVVPPGTPGTGRVAGLVTAYRPQEGPPRVEVQLLAGIESDAGQATASLPPLWALLLATNLLHAVHACLPDTSAEAAAPVAKQLPSAWEALNFLTLALTVQAGVAPLPPVYATAVVEAAQQQVTGALDYFATLHAHQGYDEAARRAALLQFLRAAYGADALKDLRAEIAKILDE